METIRVVTTNEERQAFEKVFGIAELNEDQRTIVYGSCFAAFAKGYAEGRKVSEGDAEARQLLAQKINYPNWWDTEKFPTLDSAILADLVRTVAKLQDENQRAENQIAENEKLRAENKRLLTENAELKKRLTKKDGESFYSMDQMRDYAEAHLKTRLYVFEDILNRTRKKFAEEANAIGTRNPAERDAYQKAAKEMHEIANQVKRTTANSFSSRVFKWGFECFGLGQVKNRTLRVCVFLEAATRLARALGVDQDAAQAVVNWVFKNEAGEVKQRVGETCMMLALLCESYGIDMMGQAEQSLLDSSEPERMKEISKNRYSNAFYCAIDSMGVS